MSAIYLSRAGQTYGPVTASELEAMRSSGEIYDYAWIFESADRGWQSLHPMPPAPLPQSKPLPTRAPHAGATAVPNPAPRRTPSVSRPVRPIEVVMHDFHHLVTGNLASLSDAGCELICEEQEENGPVFSERARLILNLLDPSTGRAMNVAASLSQVARKNGHWSYQLNWEQVPEILL